MKKHTLFAVQVVRIWVPLAFLATAMCAGAYGVGQQVLRQSAYDPGIQVAEDTATLLQNGADPHALIPSSTSIVDISRSVAPYLAIYDDKGTAVAWSGSVNGAAPMPPAGVFDWTRTVGEDRLSWQPQEDVRSAIVMVHYGGANPGFVMAGRSLRETEVRTEHIGALMFVGWVFTLIGLFVLVAASQWLREELKKHHHG